MKWNANEGGYVKHMRLDLDLNLGFVKSGSHAMWRFTHSMFNACDQCVNYA